MLQQDSLAWTEAITWLNWAKEQNKKIDTVVMWIYTVWREKKNLITFGSQIQFF